MKFAITITLCTLSVVLVMPIITMAQDSNSRTERKECERFAGAERMLCETDGSTTQTELTLEEDADEPMEFGKSRTDFRHIRDDVDNLQALRVTVLERDELNLQALANAVAEIRKRAKRLQENLALPQSVNVPLKELERPTDRSQLKLSVSALSLLIVNVVRNQLLEGHVLDVIASAKVGSDLDAIVELSGLIKRQCESLIRSEREVNHRRVGW